jgi:predicted Rossmann fold flavoprotein
MIDPFPGIDRESLEKAFLEEFKKYPNRILRNCLGNFVPQMLAAQICLLVPVDAGKTVNDVTKEERRRLVEALKNIRITVTGVLDVEAGMVTEGGVDLKNIDGKTMRSKIIGNLFFAGEIINVHGRTGGFNLQQSWATGHLAGESAAGK